jgi:hypothetical protein
VRDDSLVNAHSQGDRRITPSKFPFHPPSSGGLMTKRSNFAKVKNVGQDVPVEEGYQE